MMRILLLGICLLSNLTASVVFSNATLWPNGILYYTIDSAIPNQQRILDAIQMWNSSTPLQIVPRTTQANYVQFVRVSGPGAVCESSLGMVGGAQSIEILDGCTTGMIAHEIGHAFGLQHEQARTDRNSFVTVLFENVDKRRYLNFEQAPALNKSYGYYDYDSIMHYAPKTFGVNDADTIESVPVGIPFGQRGALSAQDIDGVSRAYGFVPASTTITSAPAGLMVTVDGNQVQTPHTFNWSAGSSHSISAPSTEGNTPAYAFVRWSDGGDTSHTITASSDLTVFCAEFQERNLLSASVAAGNGTVTPQPMSMDGSYPARQPVLVQASPASGSVFVSWGTSTDLLANGESGSASSVVSEVLNPSTQFLATFSSSPVTTVDSKPTGRRIAVDGTMYFTPASFTWQPGTSHTLDAQTNQTDTTGTAVFPFTSWQDGNSSSTRTITAGSGSGSFVATYAPRYLLTVSTVGNGAVAASPSSADGYYDAGAVVQITATPAAGSFFRYWLGDPTGGNPSISVTMDQQKMATAYFNSINSILVTSALSYVANPVFNQTGAGVAPGELVSVFGNNIGPSSFTSGQLDSGKFTTLLAGVQVAFSGVAAPIIFAAPNQINAVVPAGLSGATTLVVSTKNGALTGSVGVNLDATAPALATADTSGRGPIAALNQDGSFNSAAHPAARGSVMTLYATGGGQWANPFPDGQAAGNDLVVPVAPVQVRVGKLPAKVLYAGTAPGLVNGVLQVNVQLPDELLGGSAIPIQLIAGDLASPPFTTIAAQ